MKKRIKLVSYVDPSLIFMPESADLSSANDYYLEPLESNISKNGIITPIIIRKNSAGRRELVCGKRRLLCARLLRMKSVPCISINCTDFQAALLRLSERLSIHPSDCFEAAEELDEFMTRFDLSLKRAAEHLGISEADAQDKLSLLRLPPKLRQKAAQNGVSQSQALMLLFLPAEEHEHALDEIISKRLGEKQTQDYINNYFSQKKKEPAKKAVIGDMRLFTNSVEKLLGTLTGAGFETELSITDENRFTNYNIRIKKKAETPCFSQMKIC